jgi:exopolyphosphatase / guanosine-5'-triphosphate,3'-diphosphate pyrophosphatase
MRRTAVIDMGSNSWRLVVYSWEPGRWWALTDEIREAVRLGEGMGDSGLLQPDPMERARHTAAVYASFCAASGVEDVVAVATSAVRDAANRDELLRAIRDQTGLEPRVIDGDEEARYGYLALANSTTISDGFGIDIGGGSVQVMRLAGRELADAESRPLGAVRVSEAFLPDEKASSKQVKALRRHVVETLEPFDWWDGAGARLAGIGGTIRNLAAAAEKRSAYPDVDVGGYVLERDDLEELIEELASRPASKRGNVRGIKPDRGDVILGGALTLAGAMDAGGFEAVEVSEAGLREGIFFERYLAPAAPPLFDDVRRSSVENLANRYAPEPDQAVHAAHVASLSLQIYDGLAAVGLHPGHETERELLWAACQLHDIGVVIDYDDHHKHSYYLITGSGLPGFTPRELVLIGLIARWHRKGDPDPEALGALERDGDRERLEVLCGVIRLAEQLERSRDQSVASVRVAADNGLVRLEARASGDATVAIWSARRNADLLERAIDREVEIVG